MSERAALVTGGSSGIGLAIARMLGSEGYGITLSARRPDKLECAATELREEGWDVEAVPANMAEEAELQALLERHRERYGRLDVLVNNAGVGIGGPFAEAEHGKALIVNTASIAGKHGQGWLSAYSATKAGVVGLSQALYKEFAGEGIQTTALCPGFVATAMTDWIEEQVPKDQMIQPEDVAGAVRYVLSTSPACHVPEVQFVRAGDVYCSCGHPWPRLDALGTVPVP